MGALVGVTVAEKTGSSGSLTHRRRSDADPEEAARGQLWSDVRSSSRVCAQRGSSPSSHRPQPGHSSSTVVTGPSQVGQNARLQALSPILEMLAPLGKNLPLKSSYSSGLTR
jgi:hypothetical protein